MSRRTGTEGEDQVEGLRDAAVHSCGAGPGGSTGSRIEVGGREPTSLAQVYRDGAGVVIMLQHNGPPRALSPASSSGRVLAPA